MRCSIHAVLDTCGTRPRLALMASTSGARGPLCAGSVRSGHAAPPAGPPTPHSLSPAPCRFSSSDDRRTRPPTPGSSRLSWSPLRASFTDARQGDSCCLPLRSVRDEGLGVARSRRGDPFGERVESTFLIAGLDDTVGVEEDDAVGRQWEHVGGVTGVRELAQAQRGFGLVGREQRDVLTAYDQGLRRLTDALAASCRPDRALDETGGALLADLTDQAPRDDATLLLARTRAIPAADTAHWEIPADRAAVSKARKWTTRQLTMWGLDDLLFTTQLIVSELVTNAIRYGRPPMDLRLIHHDVLVCEVTDSSSTQPRLRRARTTDEGGRGLFLVGQLGGRWGCRHGQNGKTIWSEQVIQDSPEATAHRSGSGQRHPQL